MSGFAPDEAPLRLNRFLARAGIGSRRRADDLIAAGRVTINGITVAGLGTLVRPGVDTVALDGQVLSLPHEETVWVVLNKPAGTLTARRDVRGRATIFELLPSEWRNLIPVGRLDQDTEGVILLTSDGEAAHRLMHPRYQIERVYLANVEGVPTEADLRRLGRGIDLGERTLARARATDVGRHLHGATIRLELHEGRKREVKRLMAAIGHPVTNLRRITFAGITASGLVPGKWRRLTSPEIDRLGVRRIGKRE